MVVDYEWETVVIGADLDAVRFAYDNKYFLIKNRSPHHHSYEGLEDEWADKIYQLYEMALVPFTDKSRGIRIFPERKVIKVFTDRKAYTINYNNLHLFDDENVEGKCLNRELLHYRVVDWFDCHGLFDVANNVIITKDRFVQKIVFFKSLRIDGDQRYLDLLCESKLTKDQLKNFEYGQTMARFKVVDLLEKSGIKDPKMTFWKRDIYPVYGTIY